MKRLLTLPLLLASLIGASQTGASQTAYFIDGYHGGIYGHLPSRQTKFMVEQLAAHPDWKINLELEPESWDSIEKSDPVNYAAFQRLIADQSAGGRIEYVNPAYGQSYLYNISGESIIRQFDYGMKKLRRHFPGIVFSTYSSEEPCFTSALPQILRSYGFRYASLKNPNTCWGGYTRAFGGELVNWIGPDGSSVLTSPRSAVEALKPRSIWETIASSNSEEYVKAAFAAGISHPVGMCLQDAGWSFGPWLRGHGYAPTKYETWRGYFAKCSSQPADWHFSQEDVLVGLMWGSQCFTAYSPKRKTFGELIDSGRENGRHGGYLERGSPAIGIARRSLANPAAVSAPRLLDSTLQRQARRHLGRQGSALDRRHRRARR
ncbi:hypothetical protein ACQ86N_03695 [Puia sp. P3]|uniref:glycoside hydrolase family 38 N-terminal domain-containing protein n=1 Tax=Puia sp. P3 TaxID=3423952 RepID=UPI003D665FC8